MPLSFSTTEQIATGRDSVQPFQAMISVVVPVTERFDQLDEVYHAHADILVKRGQLFEFLFVVDAGLAHAIRPLEPLMAINCPIRTIQLSRDFGESTALAVGFEQAQGEIIVTLPAYFQVEAVAIEQVLDGLRRGCDLIVVRRWPRRDSIVNRMQNSGFHFLLRRLTGIDFRDIGCGVRGFKKRVISEVHLYGDLHRFIPVLAYQRGFRVEEICVAQHPRDAVLRIYRPGVYLRRVLDMLTVVFLVKFTKKPLRFFGLIAVGLFSSGAVISIILAFQRIMGMTALADRPLLILGVLLMVLGVQVGSIGLLGEIIIFTHARKMKDYAIGRVLR